jgi:hypothetical protein
MSIRRRMTRVHLTGLSISASIAVALALSGAALPGNATGDEPEPLGVTEAELIDAQMFAELKGISLDEAKLQLSNDHAAGPIVDAARRIAGDRFAGAWIDRAPWTLTIAVTGSEKFKGLEQLTVSASIPVNIDYGAVSSELELVAEAERLAKWAVSTGGIDGVGVSPRTGALMIDTNSSAPAGIASKVPTAFPVIVSVSAEPAKSEYRGGVALTSCTAGFTVKSTSTTQRGIVTAGHCGNTQAYALTPTGTPTYSTTYGGQLWGSTYDLQYHRVTSHTSTGVFYGPSATTPTTRVGSGTAVLDQFLCHRGKVTGYSCGEVVSTSFAPTWANACNTSTCSAVFVKVQHPALQGLPGDSGGPWFYGAAAYGIHMGGSVGWKVYSPIGKISSLGLALL